MTTAKDLYSSTYDILQALTEAGDGGIALNDSGINLDALLKAPPAQQPVYAASERQLGGAPQPAKTLTKENKRLAELQASADKLDAGIVWSVDAKGNFSVTNIPTINASAVARKIGSSIPTTAPELPKSPTMATLDEQMVSIAALPTDQRLQGLITLQGTVQLYKAQRQTSALAAAENEFGVATLKSDLARNIAADKRSPSYDQFLSDSPITQKVRTAYEDALLKAQTRAGALVATDGELNAILAKTKGFIASQMTGINAVQERAAKALDATQEMRKVASWVQGRPINDSDIVKGFEKYAKYEALAANPAALVEQAIANRDPGAASILLHKQAETVSKTTDENSPVYQAVLRKTNKEIAAMAGIMTDNNLFEEVYKTLHASEGEKKLQATLALLKTNPKEYEQIRKQTAEAFIQEISLSQLQEDIGSWIMASPDGQIINPFGVEGPLHDAFLKAKSVNAAGKVGLASLVKEIKEFSKDKSAIAMDQLEGALQNAYKHSSGGYYGRSIDSLDTKMLLNKAIVQSSVFKGIAGTIASDAAAGAGIGAALGVLPSFLTGGLSVLAGAATGAGIGTAAGIFRELDKYLVSPSPEGK